MDVTSLALVASKLQLWMDANLADEREPAFTGVQAGAFLIDAALAATPRTACDQALLDYVEQVLRAYGVHVHAVAYVPTPQEAALAAAEEIRKKAQAPPEAVAAAALAARVVAVVGAGKGAR